MFRCSSWRHSPQLPGQNSASDCPSNPANDRSLSQEIPSRQDVVMIKEHSLSCSLFFVWHVLGAVVAFTCGVYLPWPHNLHSVPAF